MDDKKKKEILQSWLDGWANDVMQMNLPGHISYQQVEDYAKELGLEVPENLTNLESIMRKKLERNS